MEAADGRATRQKGTHQAKSQGVLDGDQANNGIWSRVLGG